MPVPAGLQGVTLTVGPLYSVDTEPIVGAPVRVTLAAQVRITDSGALLPSTESTETDATGLATLELVASDSTGLDTTGFTYNIEVPGLTTGDGVDVILPAENPTVRLEELVAVTQSAGVTLYVPADISDALMNTVVQDTGSLTRGSLETLYGGGVDIVDGRTGTVTLGDLYDPLGAAAAAQANLDTHKTSTDHDGRYYTEAEVDALLAQRAALLHAAEHGRAGTDPVPIASLSTGAVIAGRSLHTDGAGGVLWVLDARDDDPRFQTGKIKRKIKWDKVGQTWGTPGAVPSWAEGNLWQSLDDVNAPRPPVEYQVEYDVWRRAPGAPWPIP